MNGIEYNSDFYEKRYKQGFGLVYPESHIIRAYRYVLEWELGITSGKVFDFGCGTGGNLKYFADMGFTPFGCDTSETAISQCKQLFGPISSNFSVSATEPDLIKMTKGNQFDIFLSNQVLYYLDDKGIRSIVDQAYKMVRPGGVFIATMMDYSCWYSQYMTGSQGDFKKCEVRSPRQSITTFVNMKRREDLPALFSPFKKLHIGWYGSQLREEEGSTTHWVYIGVRT